MHINHKKLTVQILSAIGIGAVVGLILNLLLNGIGGWSGLGTGEGESGRWIQVGVVDGLFFVVGKMFVRLLQMLVVPLVLVSLIVGTAALGDIGKLGRIGAKTVGFYLCTTAIAITLALSLAWVIKPGVVTGPDGAPVRFESTGEFEAVDPPPLSEVILNVVPTNPFSAMADAEMLQVIVFAILFGIALVVSGDAGRRVLEFLEAVNEIILKLVMMLMLAAPYGVFALIAQTFADKGLIAMGPLVKYFFTVLLVLAIHACITYPALLKILSGLNPFAFLKKFSEAQLFAFSTASSNATIPVTKRVCEEKLGVDSSITSFTVPLGATINMDGTAIMQGVATVFIAQGFGYDLTVAQLLMVVLTATLASIGTAGVPGVGTIMLSMVLTQVGLPQDGILLILGVDRLLDMTRTAVNITGDAIVTCIVGKSEGQFDGAVFDDPDAGQEE